MPDSSPECDSKRDRERDRLARNARDDVAASVIDDTTAGEATSTATPSGRPADTSVDSADAIPHRAEAADATRMPPWIPRLLWLIVFVTLTTLAALWFAAQVSELLKILLIALFLSFALEPAVNKLSRHRWRRGPATLVTLFGFFLVMGLFLGSMVPLVLDQAGKLIDNSPKYLSEIQRLSKGLGLNLENLTQRDVLAKLQSVSGNLQSLATDVLGNVLGVGAAVLGALFQLMTVLLFTFYLTAQGPRFRRTLCSVLRPDRQRMVLRIWEISIEKTGGYLYSRLILAICGAIAAWIVFSIAQIPYALALAMWFGVVSQFIPVIGTYIAAVLPGLVALVIDPLHAVIVIVFVVIYQAVENYVISPKITSQTMQIHPAVAFGSAIAGGSILGVIGALLALPTAAIVQAFISSVVARHEVVDSPLTLQLEKQMDQQAQHQHHPQSGDPWSRRRKTATSAADSPDAAPLTASAPDGDDPATA